MMDSRRRTGARMLRLLGTPRTTSQDEPRDAKADGDDAAATRRVRVLGRRPGTLAGSRGLSLAQTHVC